MTDLVPQHEHERAFLLQPQMVEMSKLLAASPFVPDSIRGDAGAVFSIVVAGHGLGMSPVAALQAFDLIKNKPYLKTEVMLGMYLRAGHTVAWGACTDRSATVRCVRGDGRGGAEVTYTIGMAQQAGLASKENWRKNPSEMLRARAVRSAMRMCATDVFLGALGIDDDNDRPEPPQPVTVVQLQQEPTTGDEFNQHRRSPQETPESPSQASEPEAALDTGPAPGTPETPPPADVEHLSDKQNRKLRAQIRELERIEGKRYSRDETLVLLAEAAGCGPLASGSDLTKDQASTAIEALDKKIGDRIEAGSDDDAQPT